MLIEELDKISRKIKELKEWEKRIDNKNPAQEERISEIKEEIRYLKLMAREKAYENLQELRLIKKEYPELFEAIKDDPNIGRIIKKIEWLVDFQPKEIDIKEIKNNRRELTKEEKLKLMISEPLILGTIDRYLLRLAEIEKEYRELHERIRNSIGTEEKELRKRFTRIKKKKEIEALKIKHILLANERFLEKIKQKKIILRDKRIKKLLESIEKTRREIKDIERWKKEMDRFLSIE